MLNFQHMSGIGKSIKDAEAYRESRELLKSLAKHLPNPTRLSQWLQIDKEMDGKDTEELPNIFQRVTRTDIPWQLGLCPHPIIKPWEVVSNDHLRSLIIWKKFGELLTVPENKQRTAVVLFRLNRLGIWVMHNLDVPKTGVYVCVPAQQFANNNITIEPLNSWAERTLKND